MVREYFTAADNFGITFPMDLDVKMKACMVGALFLIVSCLFLSHVVILTYIELLASTHSGYIYISAMPIKHFLSYIIIQL